MIDSLRQSPKGQTPEDQARNQLATSFGYKDVRPEDKSGMVGDLFARVADRYDLMNDLMSGGVHRLWKAAMVDVLAPRPGIRMVDVAGGTGDIAFRILDRMKRRGGSPSPQNGSPAKRESPPATITVADINPAMLAVGRDRAIDRNLAFRHRLALPPMPSACRSKTAAWTPTPSRSASATSPILIEPSPKRAGC